MKDRLDFFPVLVYTINRNKAKLHYEKKKNYLARANSPKYSVMANMMNDRDDVVFKAAHIFEAYFFFKGLKAGNYN